MAELDLILSKLTKCHIPTIVHNVLKLVVTKFHNFSGENGNIM